MRVLSSPRAAMSGITWIRAVLVSGHGVASGQSTTSPYPGGTIALQQPFFAELGLDLSDCWPGTLNLSVAPLELRLRDPDHRFPLMEWTDRHPPETFSFWRIQLLTPDDAAVDGWIYQPDPTTKIRHKQPLNVVEVLAPRLQGISPGVSLQFRDRLNRIHTIDAIRLRARLLEFLKFRVLAAQDTFFATTGVELRRAWLRDHHPEALALDDAALDQVWNQARGLYTEE